MSFLERTLASYKSGEVITPYLEEALITTDWAEEYPVKVFNKERKFDGYFHPSSDALTPELQLYYKFHPEWRKLVPDEKISPTLNLTFQIGSAFHAVIQNLLIHLGFTTLDKVEVKFKNDERNIAGAVDVLELTLPNGESYLVDIKSTNMLPKEASYPYRMQLNLYQDNCPGAPDKMALLFIEKSYPHRIKDIVVDKEPEELDKIYSKWDRVRVAIGKDSSEGLKECCIGPGSKEFNECSMKSFCEKWNQ